MIPWIAAALLSQAAMADECDAKAIMAELDEASPVNMPKIYTALAACDEKAAKKLTPSVFEKLLAGSETNQAVLAAITLGEGENVRVWLNGLEPDDRSRSVSWLGTQCATSEPVQTFFTDARAEVGETFWKDRWYRGLDACRVEPIQELLTQALSDKELAKNSSLYFGVVEVYARNLGAEAIPTLSALAEQHTDEEILTMLVNAFSDAANVGSTEGVNAKAAGLAARAIEAMGPKLPPRAIEQARVTLNNLDAEDVADSFAAHRWPDRMHEGSYHYAIVLVETAVCKNTKKTAIVHHASFTNTGTLWPDQLEETLKGKLEHEWDLTAATKCKGTGELSFELPKEPFADLASVESWLEDKVEAVDSSGYDKFKRLGHDDFDL